MSNVPEYAIDFFLKHDIPLGLTIDAEGLGATKALKANMKEHKKPFAYNTAQCNEGHKIKTRHGHCPVCSTAAVQYELKAISYGVLYIAGSIIGKLIKVGSTKNVVFREESLNKTKYASMIDWKIIFSANCMDVGTIESKIHLSPNLKKHGFKGSYKHDNHLQVCDEIYKCNYEEVKSEVLNVINLEQVDLFDLIEVKHIAKRYNFNSVQ